MTTITLPRADIAMTETVSGAPTRDWYRWARDITERVGGVVGTGTNELAASAFEDAGIEETKAALYRLADDIGAVPACQPAVIDQDPQPSIAQLLAEVAELRKEVEGLKSGTVA